MGMLIRAEHHDAKAIRELDVECVMDIGQRAMTTIALLTIIAFACTCFYVGVQVGRMDTQSATLNKALKGE